MYYPEVNCYRDASVRFVNSFGNQNYDTETSHHLVFAVRVTDVSHRLQCEAVTGTIATTSYLLREHSSTGMYRIRPYRAG